MGERDYGIRNFRERFSLWLTGKPHIERVKPLHPKVNGDGYMLCREGLARHINDFGWIEHKVFRGGKFVAENPELGSLLIDYDGKLQRVVGIGEPQAMYKTVLCASRFRDAVFVAPVSIEYELLLFDAIAMNRAMDKAKVKAEGKQKRIRGKPKVAL